MTQSAIPVLSTLDAKLDVALTLLAEAIEEMESEFTWASPGIEAAMMQDAQRKLTDAHALVSTVISWRPF